MVALDPLTGVSRHGGHRRCRVGVNSEARRVARAQSPRLVVALSGPIVVGRSWPWSIEETGMSAGWGRAADRPRALGDRLELRGADRPWRSRPAGGRRCPAGTGSAANAACRRPARRPTLAGLQATIDARLAAAEAALRSRLDLALDEREMTARASPQRRGDRASPAPRRRARRRPAGRQDRARPGARRSTRCGPSGSHDGGAGGVAVATSRIEELHSAAIRDAVQVAETVAASRLAAIRESLGAELRRPGEEARPRSSGASACSNGGWRSS